MAILSITKEEAKESVHILYSSGLIREKEKLDLLYKICKSEILQ